MATTTYEPIVSYTIPSNTTSVTIGSGGQGTIPSNYTDLVLVVGNFGMSSGASAVRLRFNGDNNNNYSATWMGGSGSPFTSLDSGTSSMRVIGAAVGPSTTNVDTVIMNIQNYANTNVNKTVLVEGALSTEVYRLSGLWRSTAAVTSITLLSYNGSDAIRAGTTLSLYGIKATDSSSSTPKASGGTITTDMLYTYHTFTSGGTFTPSQNLTADVLIVGGGGGSGDANAGGGGAGGVIYAPARSFTNATAYTAVIGAGGGANAGGVASTFNGLSATGGGYSIGEGSSGTNGGSGGGGGGGGGSGATFAAGISTGSSGADYTFYGNSGGLGRSNYNSGGGGGAGAVGSPAKGQDAGSGAGDGGVGLQTWSSWLTATNTGHNVNGVRYIAGGGGGGANSGPVGVGGYGGGGTGKSDSSTGSQTPGTANTGGGAGGSGGISSRGGTNGGSGLIIIRYLKA